MKNIAAAIIAFVGPVQGASIPAARNVEAHSSLAPRADCSNITCTPASGAAHIVVSRASTEAPGTGVLGSVAEAIVASRPGSDIATNPYPALLDPYLESETAGVGNLTEIVLEYQTCCPDSKMVLLGYSQGAQVTADFLCGRSSAGFPPTPPYSAVVTENVAAVVLMGDPSFVKNLFWDRGNASNVSYFPRIDNAACLPVADKMISYCDENDYFCSNGTTPDALTIHQTYVQRYGTEAAEYVVDKIGCAE
ncbi:cutinase [Diaporthe sp. PMI_573]|nr:cutinase [Diaporthaceae sp. PMI_573]